MVSIKYGMIALQNIMRLGFCRRNFYNNLETGAMVEADVQGFPLCRDFDVFTDNFGAGDPPRSSAVSQIRVLTCSCMHTPTCTHCMDTIILK